MRAWAKIAVAIVSASVLTGATATVGSYMEAFDSDPDFFGVLHIYSPPGDGLSCPTDAELEAVTDVDGEIYCYIGQTEPMDTDHWHAIDYELIDDRGSMALRMKKSWTGHVYVEIRHSDLPGDLLILTILKESGAGKGFYNLYSPRCDRLNLPDSSVVRFSDAACAIGSDIATDVSVEMALNGSLFDDAEFRLLVRKAGTPLSIAADRGMATVPESEIDEQALLIEMVDREIARNAAELYCLMQYQRECEATEKGPLLKLEYQEGWFYRDGRLAPKEEWPW